MTKEEYNEIERAVRSALVSAGGVESSSVVLFGKVRVGCSSDLGGFGSRLVIKSAEFTVDHPERRVSYKCERPADIEKTVAKILARVEVAKVAYESQEKQFQRKREAREGMQRRFLSAREIVGFGTEVEGRVYMSLSDFEDLAKKMQSEKEKGINGNQTN
jgi:hypothetical protein